MKCKKMYCGHTQCHLIEGHSGYCKVVWDRHSVNYCSHIKCQLKADHSGRCSFTWNTDMPRCLVVHDTGDGFPVQCSLNEGHPDADGHGGHKFENKNPFSHYVKDVSKLQKLDVYRVLELFEVKSPAIQHAIKKLLAAGKRGSKSVEKDVEEAIISLERWQDMRSEEK